LDYESFTFVVKFESMKISFKSLALWLFGSLALLSCKKENQIISKKNSPGLEAFTTSQNFLPTNEQGILKFETLAQLDFLEKEVQLTSSDLTLEEILEDLEAQLGIVSLRTVWNNQFEALNDIGFNDLQEAPIKSIYFDPILWTFLNSNGNLIVADNLYHVINDSTILTVENYSSVDISNINSINTVEEAKSISNSSISSKEVFFDGVNIIGSLTSSYKTTGDTVWGLTASVSKNGPTASACAPHMSYNVGGVVLDYEIATGTYHPSRFLEINWGDGTITSGLFTGPNLSFTEHTYSNSGTFNIVVKAKPDQYGYYPVSKTIQLIVPPFSCSNSGIAQNDTKWAFSSDLTRAVKGCLCAKIPLIGNAIKIIAETECFKWSNSSNKWKKEKANTISASISTDMLEIFGCQPLAHLSGSEYKTKKKKVDCMKSFYIPQGYPNLNITHITYALVNSVHSINDGPSKNATVNLSIQTCP